MSRWFDRTLLASVLVVFILFAEMGIMQDLIDPVVFVEEGEEGDYIEEGHGYNSRVAANIFRLINKH